MPHGFTVFLTFNFVFNLCYVQEEVLVVLDLVSCSLDPYVGKGELMACASPCRDRALQEIN